MDVKPVINMAAKTGPEKTLEEFLAEMSWLDKDSALRTLQTQLYQLYMTANTRLRDCENLTDAIEKLQTSEKQIKPSTKDGLLNFTPYYG